MKSKVVRLNEEELQFLIEPVSRELYFVENIILNEDYNQYHDEKITKKYYEFLCKLNVKLSD